MFPLEKLITTQLVSKFLMVMGFSNGKDGLFYWVEDKETKGVFTPKFWTDLKPEDIESESLTRAWTASELIALLPADQKKYDTLYALTVTKLAGDSFVCSYQAAGQQEEDKLFSGENEAEALAKLVITKRFDKKI